MISGRSLGRARDTNEELVRGFVKRVVNNVYFELCLMNFMIEAVYEARAIAAKMAS
jgi:hypothetical protein